MESYIQQWKSEQRMKRRDFMTNRRQSNASLEQKSGIQKIKPRSYNNSSQQSYKQATLSMPKSSSISQLRPNDFKGLLLYDHPIAVQRISSTHTSSIRRELSSRQLTSRPSTHFRPITQQASSTQAPHSQEKRQTYYEIQKFERTFGKNPKNVGFPRIHLEMFKHNINSQSSFLPKRLNCFKMAICSILTPATTLQPQSDYTAACAELLDIPPGTFELFAVVPISSIDNPSEIAIKLLESDFSLQNIENLIEQNKRLNILLQQARQAASTILEQSQKSPAGLRDDKYKRRMKKLRQLDEDNKKLRQLLKQFLSRVQLENSENLRLETQQTVETLRGEFDILVRQLTYYEAQDGVRSGGEKKPQLPKLNMQFLSRGTQR